MDPCYQENISHTSISLHAMCIKDIVVVLKSV